MKKFIYNNDVPEYLKDTTLYENFFLNEDTNNMFIDPLRFKKTDVVESLDDLEFLFETANFWGLKYVPQSVFNFIFDNFSKTVADHKKIKKDDENRLLTLIEKYDIDGELLTFYKVINFKLSFSLYNEYKRIIDDKIKIPFFNYYPVNTVWLETQLYPYQCRMDPYHNKFNIYLDGNDHSNLSLLSVALVFNYKNMLKFALEYEDTQYDYNTLKYASLHNNFDLIYNYIPKRLDRTHFDAEYFSLMEERRHLFLRGKQKIFRCRVKCLLNIREYLDEYTEQIASLVSPNTFLIFIVNDRLENIEKLYNDCIDNYMIPALAAPNGTLEKLKRIFFPKQLVSQCLINIKNEHRFNQYINFFDKNRIDAVDKSYFYYRYIYLNKPDQINNLINKYQKTDFLMFVWNIVRYDRIDILKTIMKEYDDMVELFEPRKIFDNPNTQQSFKSLKSHILMNIYYMALIYNNSTFLSYSIKKLSDYEVNFIDDLSSYIIANITNISNLKIIKNEQLDIFYKKRFKINIGILHMFSFYKFRLSQLYPNIQKIIFSNIYKTSIYFYLNLLKSQNLHKNKNELLERIKFLIKENAIFEDGDILNIVIQYGTDDFINFIYNESVYKLRYVLNIFDYVELSYNNNVFAAILQDKCSISFLKYFLNKSKRLNHHKLLSKMLHVTRTYAYVREDANFLNTFKIIYEFFKNSIKSYPFIMSLFSRKYLNIATSKKMYCIIKYLTEEQNVEFEINSLKICIYYNNYELYKHILDTTDLTIAKDDLIDLSIKLSRKHFLKINNITTKNQCCISQH